MLHVFLLDSELQIEFPTKLHDDGLKAMSRQLGIKCKVLIEGNVLPTQRNGKIDKSLDLILCVLRHLIGIDEKLTLLKTSSLFTSRHVNERFLLFYSYPHRPQQRLHSRRNQWIQQKEEEEETSQVCKNASRSQAKLPSLNLTFMNFQPHNFYQLSIGRTRKGVQRSTLSRCLRSRNVIAQNRSSRRQNTGELS